MSTLKTVNLQNPASGIVNGTLNADGTTTFGGVVNFDSAQTFPNAITSLTAGTGLLGGTITTTGTVSLDTTYTDTLYLGLSGGTMTGDIVFAGTQTFPNAVSSVTAGVGLLGGTITTSGTIDLDTAYTDGIYLGLAGGTMTGDIIFNGTQSFPGALSLAGGTMTGDITFSGTQTFPAQDLDTVTTAGNTTVNNIDVGGLTASGLNYPSVDGTANQALTTDGAGNLGWLSTAEVVSVPGSSAAGGSFGQIAFGGGNFYFHDGAQWWQVAGVAF